MAKKLIYIHGRDIKPSKLEKERLVRMALLQGLGRVDSNAVDSFVNGKIELLVAYYGDISNIIMKYPNDISNSIINEGIADPKTYWDVSPNADQHLLALKNYSIAEQGSKERYSDFMGANLYAQVKDDFLKYAGKIASFFNYDDEIINRFCPDLKAYFKSRIVGSLIRDRLQEILVPALVAGDDICIVAHSMGTIVAYDVLWKLSRMSEYKHLFEKKVNLLITLGSPLGEEGVIKQLYDNNEYSSGRYPTNIRYWQNFSAKDDLVCTQDKLEPIYSNMKKRHYLNDIYDTPIYNYYIGDNGINQHKSYGYLDNHKVAKVIADWTYI